MVALRSQGNWRWDGPLGTPQGLVHWKRALSAVEAGSSGFLSRETGISGNFVGRIKGAKCPFDLQFLTWDFS